MEINAEVRKAPRTSIYGHNVIGQVKNTKTKNIVFFGAPWPAKTTYCMNCKVLLCTHNIQLDIILTVDSGGF